MSVPEQIDSIQNSLEVSFLKELVDIFTLSMEPNNEYQEQIYKVRPYFRIRELKLSKRKKNSAFIWHPCFRRRVSTKWSE